MTDSLPLVVALAGAALLTSGPRAWADRPIPAHGTVAERVLREAYAMGTSVRVLAEAGDRGAAEAASEAVLREIERLEDLTTTWRSDSELSALNAAPAGMPKRISRELADLLREAMAWVDATGGAFDPTTGALADAWGIRGERRTPSEMEVIAALGASGPDAVVLDGLDGTRHSAAVWIDSGAFGKGAALRAVPGIARTHGAARMLVDLGGQLWAEAPADAPWAVVVAHPLERSTPAARLSLHGASVATSGQSERPDHVLDPRTGRPAPAWGSVTVVATDPLEADVLSTALFVMGPEQGLSWARSNGTAALFLETMDGGLRSTWTEAMRPWLVTP